MNIYKPLEWNAFVSAAVATSIVLLVLFPAQSAWAQEWHLGEAVARPVPGAGHDYIHMLNETVNPATGSLSLRIGLPVPKSRGLTLPFAITYDSGDAHAVSSATQGTAGYDVGTITNRAQFGHGWGDTAPYATATYQDVPIYSRESGVSTLAGTCPVSSFYNFYDAPGSSHTLQLAAIGLYRGK